MAHERAPTWRVDAASAARAAAARAVVDVVVENALAVPTRWRARVASIFIAAALVAFFLLRRLGVA